MLDDYELNVLKVVGGYAVQNMTWGAAMGQAIECLHGSGYVTTEAGVYKLTDKGREALEPALRLRLVKV